MEKLENSLQSINTLLMSQLNDLEQECSLDSIKTVFDSNDEWQNKKKQLFKNIKKCIQTLTFPDKKQSNGLSVSQEEKIIDILIQQLSVITNKEEWCENTAANVLIGIKGFIHGLQSINKWEQLSNSLQKNEFHTLLYKNIKWQLSNSECSLFDDIVCFRCIKCKEIVSELLDNNLCEECS